MGTTIDGTRSDINADIFRIPGELKLRAVPAAEFDDGANTSRSNKLVQDLGLELRKVTVGTWAGGAALAVHTIPKRSGARKCEPARTGKSGKLRQFTGSRADERNALDKFFQTRSVRTFAGHIDSHLSRVCACYFIGIQPLHYAAGRCTPGKRNVKSWCLSDCGPLS